MKNRERKAAEILGILDRLEALEADLLKVNRIVKVEFDVDGFFDDIPDVCIVYEYDVPVGLENYFEERRRIIRESVEVMERHGLTASGDAIEDYGTHFYFVRNAKTWEYRNPYNPNP